MDGATVIAFDKSLKKILLVKRRDVPVWVLPGGGIEEGETPLQAAIREAKEETGFNIKVVRQVAKYTHRESHKKNFLFEAKCQESLLVDTHSMNEVDGIWLAAS